MSDVLKLQEDEPETPDEEKGKSAVSLYACLNSHWSVLLCAHW